MDDFCVEFLSYLLALRLYLRGSASISRVERECQNVLVRRKEKKLNLGDLKGTIRISEIFSTSTNENQD